MIRNVLGSLVALAGAASAVLSPFRDWYAGRAGQDYRVENLFGGITAAESGVLVSMLLPFLAAALLVIVGVVLRSRLVVAVAGLVVLGFTVLWMVRQGQAAGSLVVAGDGSGLQVGVVNALAGGVLMLIGALLMSGRGRQVRRSRRDREREPVEPYAAPAADQVDTWPPTQEPGMSVQTSPWPEPEVDPYTGPDPRAPGTRSYPQADPHPEDDPRDPVHPPHRPPQG
ncbi:hypothetical protein YW3DRAFT_01399 [Streptomyces sp. MnatMP-M77]|uniref:hypothetical protein n=1 Tax=unclassified Streptomyces TaxID=2593676 RepID=UPI000804C783|nr:hypothetical protein [Streptomyces sp. MnatMP-M77]MYT80502.1 hypothetical protein [Streptomyces sp. SID8364]SBV00083.1 hypothetical protein YW3DRAFT_01399 [Streptomyces sp. MnatMP-M77]